MSNQTRLTMEEIKSYRGQGSGRRSGGYLRFYCPIHGSDNQHSLSLDPETGSFKCFACGAWGYLEEKRQEWIEDQKKEAQQDEGGSRGRRRFPDPTGSKNGRDTEKAEADIGMVADRDEKLQKVLSRLQKKLPGSPGEEYLEKRGIPLKLAQKYGVGYTPYGEWPHRNRKGKPIRQWKPGRVVFPHTDLEGWVINLYGRAVGNGVPKSQRHDHLPGSKGIFNARALDVDTAFVCEGVFDALSLIAAGHKNACAIFGVDGLRWDWVGARRVVFCMDPDEGGSRWKDLAQEGLLLGKEVYFLPEEVYAGYEDLNALWLAMGRLDVGRWEQSGEEIKGAEEQAACNNSTPAVSSGGGRPAVRSGEWEELHRAHRYDPRPDLSEDSGLWRAVLEVALAKDEKIYGILHGVRCIGARLVLENGELRLEPRIGEGIEDEEDWWQVRLKWLVPQTKTIVQVFREAVRELKRRQL